MFVTLKAHGELRGCIGHIESHRPVGELVGDIAVRSALDDPRFPPLQPEELEAVTFQISLLSPLHRIGGPEDITVGRHGLLLELGPHRGLLLPQVAVEFGWTAIEFLEATARKAGLHREAWRDRGAMLSVFTAEIIDEAVIGHGTPADHPAM